MFTKFNLKISYALLVLFFAVSTFIIFSGLSVPPIEKWDESTNIQVVSESSNFISLRLNGDPFFEKPPLWYDSASIITDIFGNDIFYYRLPSALCFEGMLILIILLVKKKYGIYPAVLSCIVFISVQQLTKSNFSFVYSTHSFKSADLDSMFIFFCFLSFYFLNLKKERYFYLSSIATALAVLTKGFAGFVPIISFLIYAFISKEMPKAKSIFLYFLISLLLILPWHIYSYIFYSKEFIDSYFIYHNFKRVSSVIENHHENIFFYFRIIADPRIFPGFIFFILSLAQIPFKKFIKDFIAAQCLINISLWLLLVTLIQTKLSWYILFIYPFTAVFIGSGFNFYSNIIQKKRDALNASLHA